MGMGVTDADNYLLGLADDFIEECKTSSNPKACFRILKNPLFDLKQYVLIVNEVCFDLGKTVTANLKKSSLIAVFACTVGKMVEERSKQLLRDGFGLEGLIVDLIGSEIAEGAAAFVHLKIESIAREANLKVTNRYSPGYCNWPVSDQHKLFSLLGNNNCGIHLTPSSLMVPIKSVSGIIGIGTDVKQVAYKCKLCNDQKCILRKIS
jgi:hypothetical protein